MDPINFKSRKDQIAYLKENGYSDEEAAKVIDEGNYKALVNAIKYGEKTGNVVDPYNAPGTVTTGSPKDTAKTDKAVEKEAAKLKSQVKPNQVNLVGETGSDPDIGKTGSQLQEENAKRAAFTGDYDEWKKINAESEEPTPSDETDAASTNASDASPNVSPKTYTAKSDQRGSTSRYTSNKTPYNQPMGILDAYYAGKFGDKDAQRKFEDFMRSSGYEGDFSDLSDQDREAYEEAKQEARNARNSRDYYILDALAKYGNKLSDATGRIAAAYGGGSYTPSNDTTSAWEDRNANLLKAGSEAETAGLEGSNQNITAEQAGQQTTSNAQAIEQKEYQLQPARIFSRVASDENAHPALRNLYAMLAGNAAGNDMDVADYIASYFAGDKDMQKLLSEVAKSGGNMANMGAEALEAINNLLGKLADLGKK